MFYLTVCNPNMIIRLPDSVMRLMQHISTISKYKVRHSLIHSKNLENTIKRDLSYRCEQAFFYEI